MATIDRAVLAEELERDEALRLKPYRCSAGKLTIGVGRNLEDLGISEEEARHLLGNDIARVLRELDLALPWWRELDPVRQRVLANMAFNLGVPGLLEFKQALSAARSGDYVRAASEMLASKWATQVGGRARRLASLMVTGGGA